MTFWCNLVGESNGCRKHHSQSQKIESSSPCKPEQTCHVDHSCFDIRLFGASGSTGSKPMAALLCCLLDEHELALLRGTIVTAGRALIRFEKWRTETTAILSCASTAQRCYFQFLGNFLYPHRRKNQGAHCPQLVKQIRSLPPVQNPHSKSAVRQNSESLGPYLTHGMLEKSPSHLLLFGIGRGI